MPAARLRRGRIPSHQSLLILRPPQISSHLATPVHDVFTVDFMHSYSISISSDESSIDTRSSGVQRGPVSGSVWVLSSYADSPFKRVLGGNYRDLEWYEAGH